MKKISPNIIVKNFLSLSAANLISTIAIMGQGMILVRALTKVDYGTYAQTNIVLNISSTIISLGLAASLNYFIPISTNSEQKQKYINTIFSLVIVTGIIGMICIFLLSDFIIIYFNNNYLNFLLPIIAFRPLFASLLQAFINLFVANRHAEVVAKRNIIMSLLSLLILGSISLLTHNVRNIVISLLVLDILQCLVLYLYCKEKWGAISFFKYDISAIKEVLTYSIPLALSAMVGTLLLQMDRLIIGKLFTTEEFAVYSVVSTPLPFTIIATAIVTVVRPYITKNFNIKNTESVKRLWSSSIEFSALITWTLGFAMILVSSDIITFLYTKSYISGLKVFEIYIVFSMINVTYYGMILSSSGKSKFILYYALASLFLNAILNFIFYWAFGFSGPALASVFSQIFINAVQLLHSSKLLKCKIREFINVKTLVNYLLTMLAILFILSYFKQIFDSYFKVNELLKIALFGGTYCSILFGLYFYRLKRLSLELKI